MLFLKAKGHEEGTKVTANLHLCMKSTANQYKAISGKEYPHKAAQTGSLCCFERLPDPRYVLFRNSPYSLHISVSQGQLPSIS